MKERRLSGSRCASRMAHPLFSSKNGHPKLAALPHTSLSLCFAWRVLWWWVRVGGGGVGWVLSWFRDHFFLLPFFFKNYGDVMGFGRVGKGCGVCLVWRVLVESL